MINKQEVKGTANELVGALKKQWAGLTDNDYLMAEGQSQEFLGKVQKKFGITAEEAKTKYNELKAGCGCSSSNKAA